LRILVLTHEFPPVGGGGARVIQDLCTGLAGRGHDLQVLTTHLVGLPRQERIDGVGVTRIPCGRKVPYRARLVEMARFVTGGFWEGLQLARAWQPEVIHVHFAVPAGALAWALSSVTRVPYVLTAHGGDVPGGAPEKTAGWFRWIYPFTHPIWRRAARVVAVSEQTRRLAQRHYPIEIQVIRNGFDFAALKRDEIRLGQPPRVIWAGRFMPEKNPVQVVRTLAQLCDLPWSCVMIGDGPEKAAVEAEIVRLKMEERITVTGWLTQGEVMDWFARSDILFMPSFMEGLPIVGLQGLAMGLAIVASRVGGFLDLVDPQHNGYLVEDPHGDGFCEPLRHLLADPLRLKSFREASHQVADRFDIRLMIQDYDALLQEAVARSR
jgi:glycosyltransferase involved in cell wall biosynthesis